MHLWFSCSCAYTCTALWKFVQPSYGGKEVHLVGDAQPDQELVIHRSSVRIWIKMPGISVSLNCHDSSQHGNMFFFPSWQRLFVKENLLEALPHPSVLDSSSPPWFLCHLQLPPLPFCLKFPKLVKTFVDVQRGD